MQLINIATRPIETANMQMSATNIQIKTHHQPVFLRQATSDDMADIISWTLSLHHHEDDGTLQTHPRMDLNLKKWIEAELTNPHSLFLIAETDRGKSIGFIGAQCVINYNGLLSDPRKGVINLLWVDVDYRERGIAEQLVAQIEQCMDNLGIKYIECGFTAGNKIGSQFWKRLNYQQVAITARKFI